MNELTEAQRSPHTFKVTGVGERAGAYTSIFPLNHCKIAGERAVERERVKEGQKGGREGRQAKRQREEFHTENESTD